MMGSLNNSIVEKLDPKKSSLASSPLLSPSSSILSAKKQSCAFLLCGILFQKSIAFTDAFPLARPNTAAPSARSFLDRKAPCGTPNLPSQISPRYAQRNSQAGSSPDTTDATKARNSDDKPGWRRRVFSKLRRKRSQDPAVHSTSMSMTAVAAMDEVMHRQKSGFAMDLDQFVLDNFEKLSPEQLFRTLEDSSYILEDCGSAFQPFIKSPLEEILPLVATMQNVTSLSASSALESTTTASSSTGVLDVEENQLLECLVPSSQLGATGTSFEGGPLTCKAVRNWFQNLLTNSFTEWAAETPVNMKVRCSPTGSVLWSIMRGELECNARVDFDRIVFDFIRLSGGSLEGSRLALNLLAFTVDKSKSQIIVEPQTGNLPKNNTASTAATGKKSLLWKSKAQAPRYQTQFDLHANDCILTQEDLFESSCVTNGLRNLLARILNRRGIRTSSIEVTHIEILKNGKISCKGEAIVLGLIPKRIPFEVRSGIDFNCRGHVLTFPGLEISLSPDVGLFVPVLPTIELDIGHNARLRELSIDGDKKLVKLAASVTITPKHTLKLNQEYTQSSHAYAARFSYDVGRWLTRIGRFSL